MKRSFSCFVLLLPDKSLSSVLFPIRRVAALHLVSCYTKQVKKEIKKTTKIHHSPCGYLSRLSSSSSSSGSSHESYHMCSRHGRVSIHPVCVSMPYQTAPSPKHPQPHKRNRGKNSPFLYPPSSADFGKTPPASHCNTDRLCSISVV